jgi:hypothetical protein
VDGTAGCAKSFQCGGGGRGWFGDKSLILQGFYGGRRVGIGEAIKEGLEPNGKSKNKQSTKPKGIKL